MDMTVRLEPWVSLLATAVLGAALVAVPAILYHKRVVDELKQHRQSRKSRGRIRDLSKNSHRRIRSRSSSKDRTSPTVCGVTKIHDKDGSKMCLSSKRPEQDRSIDHKSALQVPFGPLSSISSGIPRVQSPHEVDTSVFGDGGGSDDDIANNQDEQTYTYEEMNEDSLACEAAILKEDSIKSTISAVASKDNANMSLERTGKPIERTCNAMSKSHSIPGELHNIHTSDPVTADILRKEPEQESYVHLHFEPFEAPSPEEEEVCRLMQECLLLRQKYVFRERIVPWKKDSIADHSSPLQNPDPFHYEQEPASKHTFKMIDGVVHVYAIDGGI
ncbi:hypothetical protein KP509_24G014400 [Ceratopteris richardii]|uniref:Uncharacterized protein n=1 Tax=Ceratopteris richardii TaxID=49495 RepID=A0A8T2RVG3_CERRI|nr:hypothetical protein KP509_24G014400 [Ceratopteris richardii]KAH7299487.1 hypothetical protein KP509_24G014400 [Ceratopteris richardii]KAH7299488.1 hypothetical protein KP509_24G014400 [Ceratopteris richardii]